MKVFGAYISTCTADWLSKMLADELCLVSANERIFGAFGIKDFFCNQSELENLLSFLRIQNLSVGESDRIEYGDFQTNEKLAEGVTRFLKKKNISPTVIVEPTCGKGSFILACLSAFPYSQRIIGVEIYEPYVWETKFSIIDYYIANPREKKTIIELYNHNVFEFDFSTLLKDVTKENVLIIGNPPWVTNAKLSTLESDNVPVKSNFKKNKGLDSITGKGNFDIGEYITLMMLNTFYAVAGTLAFLVKNAVIKNIMYDQRQNNYNISGIEKHVIDSKKEFGVSVDASLMYCTLNSPAEYVCSEFDFYNDSVSVREFGWVNNKFVSDTNLYKHAHYIDGDCPFEWRQGVKHDLSLIMELEKENGHFVNGNNEKVVLEDDLIFGVLKSSDLKKNVVKHPRKYTIMTQKNVGEDTVYIKEKFPKTYSYLSANKEQFARRKSVIYNNKPDFSIFGVGDYSFAPYKIAISGLYKTYTFSLIMPYTDKPIMLDDTCYLLGFDCIEFAVYTLILLNSETVKKFLQSITFADAKRTFTKDVLKRIDIYKVANIIPNDILLQKINEMNLENELNVTLDRWNDYIDSMKTKDFRPPLSLF